MIVTTSKMEMTVGDALTLPVLNSAVTPAPTVIGPAVVIFGYNCSNGYFRKYSEGHSYSYG